MRLGISGTRNGFIDPQRIAFGQRIEALYLKSPIVEMHHGDCIGVDASAHNYFMTYHPETKIWCHPPKNPKNRAHCKGAFFTFPEEEYLLRNIRIVNNTHALVACPKGMSEDFRGSGTWHAIRYAISLGHPVTIIWPNGTIETR